MGQGVTRRFSGEDFISLSLPLSSQEKGLVNMSNHALSVLIIIGILGTVQMGISSPKVVQLEITTPVGSIRLK